ncbi:unnamed protein product [Cyprideis torosa]|uniref:Uncharacterized protein n=1 Tax=Cyprideis torosa TaxID=163714 RepID=A0A7R8ZMM7_9CRUS|nr:unnamed protein product [Cyprideis torosa]CAG0889271.1 unnamed protein product [Cyprideis torosa]
MLRHLRWHAFPLTFKEPRLEVEEEEQNDELEAPTAVGTLLMSIQELELGKPANEASSISSLKATRDNSTDQVNLRLRKTTRRSPGKFLRGIRRLQLFKRTEVAAAGTSSPACSSGNDADGSESSVAESKSDEESNNDDENKTSSAGGYSSRTDTAGGSDNSSSDDDTSSESSEESSDESYITGPLDPVSGGAAFLFDDKGKNTCSSFLPGGTAAVILFPQAPPPEEEDGFRLLFSANDMEGFPRRPLTRAEKIRRYLYQNGRMQKVLPYKVPRRGTAGLAKSNSTQKHRKTMVYEDAPGSFKVRLRYPYLRQLNLLRMLTALVLANPSQTAFTY